jgi:hypothetical protein
LGRFLVLKEWIMSTALREPPQGLRMGRLVKVAAKPSKSQACPKRAEPPVPRSEEVRLLAYFGLGGAACLAVLALAGILLFARDDSNLEQLAELATPSAASANVEAREADGEVLPEPALDPAEVEVLPQPLEAGLQIPALALLAAESTARQDVEPVPPSPAQALAVDKPQPRPVCQKFGTKIDFLQNPLDAFRKAREENKQVFFVHLSGNFEDQAFT